jgi:putative oxidoreductase
MMNTTTVTARPTARDGGRANTLLWAAQIVLAAVFAIAAVPKLTGAHIAVTMFGQIGAGQWLRYLVGIAELAGAAGLLIPRRALRRARRARAPRRRHPPVPARRPR